MIHQADLGWNSSYNFNIAPVTTQLPLLLRRTICTTALYNIPRAHTIDPVFVSTLDIIPHHCQVFCRLWYTAVQLLLLCVMVWPRYGKASTGCSESTLIRMDTPLSSNQCYRVSFWFFLASPIWTFFYCPWLQWNLEPVYLTCTIV